MASTSAPPPALLTGVLREVSRSFYLTLRALPGAIRPQISLAYLLARATDTIADTEIVPWEQRREALGALRERILGRRQAPVEFSALAAHQATAGEGILLAHLEEAISLLAQFSADDQSRIRAVLEIITSGQELDLGRFSGATATRIVALGTRAELDDYTYRVAGCVGEFWTRMCRAHLFPAAPLDEAKLLADGVRFGRGLQMVNILRDLPRDLRQGRCYVPQADLSAHGLAPTDLLDLETMPRFRALYDELIEVAQAHLAAGWNYTNTLPSSCLRVRLACALPVLIGARTLARLRRVNVLDAAHRIKITRGEVRSLVCRTVALYPWRRRWIRLFEAASGRTGNPA
jgi:farnesyl-diphosphate farnesyltransferase